MVTDAKGNTVCPALLGIMKAALLFYQRFLKNIKSIGFELTIDHFDTVVHNDIGFVFVIVIVVHWKVSLLGLLGTT
jgi:hypothetical protein